MNEKEFITAFKAMRENTKPRKFKQTIELMINFRGLDFKKAQNQVDLKVSLPYATGKASGKSILFAKDQHFISQMKGKVDRIVLEEDIAKFKKKEIAAIANEFDALIAEGPVMIAVGKFLGQELATKGKMPKPVKPEVAAAEQALRQMSSVTRVTNKKGKFMPVVQIVLGSEEMNDAQLAENAKTVVDAVVASLPGKLHNLKNVYVKQTMGPAILVGKKAGA